MKIQQIGKPEVAFSWFIEEDNYTRDNHQTTLASAKGKEQLINTILLCIDQGMEIRIGSDGTCLIFEANNVSFDGGSYQFVDEDHYVEKFNTDTLEEDGGDIND